MVFKVLYRNGIQSTVQKSYSKYYTAIDFKVLYRNGIQSTIQKSFSKYYTEIVFKVLYRNRIQMHLYFFEFVRLTLQGTALPLILPS